MMQLMRGYLRPAPHAQLPARRRAATKDRARRLATSLVGAMLLFASISLLIRDRSQAGEQALAPDSGQARVGAHAPPPPPDPRPANGAAQADAVALAHAQAVAMADAAAETAAKDTVDVDGGVRSLRREDDSEGERENAGTDRYQSINAGSAQNAELARAAAAARAALNDGSLDDESGDGRGAPEQQPNENNDHERIQDEANDGLGSEPRRLEPEDRQRQVSIGTSSENEDIKQLDGETSRKGVGWLWGVGKKPRNAYKNQVGPSPPKYAEQGEGVDMARRNSVRDAPYGESIQHQPSAANSEQHRDDSVNNDVQRPVTTGAGIAEDSGDDEDRSISQPQLNNEPTQVQTQVRNTDIDTQPEARKADTDDYFAGFRSRTGSTSRTPPEYEETHERLTTRDFGVVFGMAIAHSAVVSAADRAHLQHHDISRDSAYQRIRSTGQMAALVSRYADALENAAAGGDESSLVYVGRANDVSMGYGLYAARALPAGTVLGEYGGRYVRVFPDKEPGDYVWHLPLLNVNKTDEAWAVDAAEWGNALRFCNDLGPGTWNVAARVVPWNGQWHVVYETITPVLENEQLSASYGRAFWARHKHIQ